MTDFDHWAACSQGVGSCSTYKNNKYLGRVKERAVNIVTCGKRQLSYFEEISFLAENSRKIPHQLTFQCKRVQLQLLL